MKMLAIDKAKDFFAPLLKAKYLLLLVAVVDLLVAFFYIKQPFLFYKDSHTYNNAVQFLLGHPIDSAIPYNRLLTTPFMLYLTILFNSVVGDVYGSMLLINFIFFFAALYFFYRTAWEIFENEKIAVYASLFFLGDYALYTWGTAYLADMGGWLFFIASSYFAILYYKRNVSKHYWLAVLLSTIGVLFKEYGGLGIIVLSFLLLSSKGSWKDRFLKIIYAGLFFSFSLLSHHFYIYLKYGYTYFDWYKYNSAEYDIGLVETIKIVGWIYLPGWLIFLYGFFKGLRGIDKWKLTILFSMLPASISFLLWSGLTQRVVFVFVPWLALFSGYGIWKINSPYFRFLIFIFYFLVNYNIHILINYINL